MLEDALMSESIRKVTETHESVIRLLNAKHRFVSRVGTICFSCLGMTPHLIEEALKKGESAALFLALAGLYIVFSSALWQIYKQHNITLLATIVCTLLNWANMWTFGNYWVLFFISIGWSLCISKYFYKTEFDFVINEYKKLGS